MTTTDRRMKSQAIVLFGKLLFFGGITRAECSAEIDALLAQEWPREMLEGFVERLERRVSAVRAGQRSWYRRRGSEVRA